MLNPMLHRGPDASGIWLGGPCGLGHRRLSIIDLSEAGRQPMSNEDGNVWITFNGEIYNYRQLRERLLSRGHFFRSGSDTEVILHLYEEMGERCVEELYGMFAFAIWDVKRQRLFLARDRVGIKPLYYYNGGKQFSFASELKGIIGDLKIPRNLDHQSVRLFLGFHYLPGERTLLQDIRRLLPGHCMTIERGEIRVNQYWDLKFSRCRWDQPFDESVDELQSLLRSTVREHMIADVPVGVLLSGGVDSSAILGLATEASAKRVQSFTVGFEGGHVVDERPYARMAASKFDSEHHEVTFTSEVFWEFLPNYVWYMEDPVYEPPAIALHYVSKLARNYVKVVLSGEGGDEAFGGYPNYPNMLRIAKLEHLGSLLSRVGRGLAMMLGSQFPESRILKYRFAINSKLEQHYFSRSSSPASYFNRKMDEVVTGGFACISHDVNPVTYMSEIMKKVRNEPLLNRMLYADTKTWLPDDLLTKADKITMANSLELRVPLLDHRVLEFAGSLPPQHKVKRSQTKRVLKAAFGRALPSEILHRKKAGFPLPVASWMANQLQEQVSELLLSENSRARGIISEKAVRTLLLENGNQHDRSREVFCLVILELWCRRFLDGGS